MLLIVQKTIRTTDRRGSTQTIVTPYCMASNKSAHAIARVLNERRAVPGKTTFAIGEQFPQIETAEEISKRLDNEDQALEAKKKGVTPEQLAAKNAALSKLTDAERKALGV